MKHGSHVSPMQKSPLLASSASSLSLCTVSMLSAIRFGLHAGTALPALRIYNQLFLSNQVPVLMDGSNLLFNFHWRCYWLPAITAHEHPLFENPEFNCYIPSVFMFTYIKFWPRKNNVFNRRITSCATAIPLTYTPKPNGVCNPVRNV